MHRLHVVELIMRYFILTIIISSIVITSVLCLIEPIQFDFLLTFSYSLLPVFLSTCVHYLIKTYLIKPQIKYGLGLQIVVLYLVMTVFIAAIHIPDYLRHQAEAGYTRYNSLQDYVDKRLLEPFTLCLLFCTIIPVTDALLKHRRFTRSET